MLESELWTAHGVRVEFMTLAQIAVNSRLGSTNALFVRPSGSSKISGDVTNTGKESSSSTSSKIEEDMMDRDDEREGEVLVSVAYYRAGYTPDDYPTELEWSARRTIEHSLATKCPTVGYQLAGTKKIQQVLCEENILEKFLSRKKSELLRKCFAGNENVRGLHFRILILYSFLYLATVHCTTLLISAIIKHDM